MLYSKGSLPIRVEILSIHTHSSCVIRSPSFPLPARGLCIFRPDAECMKIRSAVTHNTEPAVDGGQSLSLSHTKQTLYSKFPIRAPAFGTEISLPLVVGVSVKNCCFWTSISLSLSLSFKRHDLTKNGLTKCLSMPAFYTAAAAVVYS